MHGRSYTRNSLAQGFSFYGVDLHGGRQLPRETQGGLLSGPVAGKWEVNKRAACKKYVKLGFLGRGNSRWSDHLELAGNFGSKCLGRRLVSLNGVAKMRPRAALHAPRWAGRTPRRARGRRAGSPSMSVRRL